MAFAFRCKYSYVPLAAFGVGVDMIWVLSTGHDPLMFWKSGLISMARLFGSLSSR